MWRVFGGRRTAVVVSSLILVGASSAWAPASGADDGGAGGGVVCAGTSHGMYDPPLTLVSRRTRVHVEAGYTCTTASGMSVPARAVLDGVSPAASCLAQSSSHPTETVRYADGTRSVVVYDDAAAVRLTGVLVTALSGRVTKGSGKGLSVRRTTPALSGQLPTECLASGLRGASGSTLLEIG